MTEWFLGLLLIAMGCMLPLAAAWLIARHDRKKHPAQAKPAAPASAKPPPATH